MEMRSHKRTAEYGQIQRHIGLGKMTTDTVIELPRCPYRRADLLTCFMRPGTLITLAVSPSRPQNPTFAQHYGWKDPSIL